MTKLYSIAFASYMQHKLKVKTKWKKQKE
jgi:hypothetical protein